MALVAMMRMMAAKREAVVVFLEQTLSLCLKLAEPLQLRLLVSLLLDGFPAAHRPASQFEKHRICWHRSQERDISPEAAASTGGGCSQSDLLVAECFEPST